MVKRFFNAAKFQQSIRRLSPEARISRTKAGFLARSLSGKAFPPGTAGQWHKQNGMFLRSLQLRVQPRFRTGFPITKAIKDLWPYTFFRRQKYGKSFNRPHRSEINGKKPSEIKKGRKKRKRKRRIKKRKNEQEGENGFTHTAFGNRPAGGRLRVPLVSAAGFAPLPETGQE